MKPLETLTSIELVFQDRAENLYMLFLKNSWAGGEVHALVVHAHVKTIPSFRPKWSNLSRVFRPKRLNNHTLGASHNYIAYIGYDVEINTATKFISYFLSSSLFLTVDIRA